MSLESGVPRGLLVDWGGVLTSGLEDALRRWAELDGFDFDSYVKAVMAWLPAETPADAAAEAELNSMLVRRDGTPVPADGLIERMFAHFEHQPAMGALVRRARSHGIRTALLSNSWGNTYPRDTWEGMFDDIVISGEVGLRKPEPEIFLLAARRLNLEPPECVFIDDAEPNVLGARAVGLDALLHTDPVSTRAALARMIPALGGAA